MRTFLAILTIALVGIHALLGCCWHHGHSCATGHDQHAMCGQTERCDVEHGDDSHEHESPHRDVCQESPCVFTTADGPGYDFAPQIILWLPNGIEANAQVGTTIQPPLEWVSIHSSAATIPVRLHLFKGLLLI